MKTIRLLLLSVLLAGPALAQIASPTFSQPTGSYLNSVFVTMQDTVAGSLICWTTDGTTPTAATPGTCDSNGHIFAAINNTGAYASFSATGTLQAIATKAAQVNSAVVSATYTVTLSATTNPISAVTPINRTSAGANVIDELPYLLTAPNGTIFMFYSESTGGVTIDNGAGARVMFKQSTDGGKTWTTPTSTGKCQGGDPGTGCFFNTSNTTYANTPNGGGVTPAGTLAVFVNTWTGGQSFIPGGINVFRSTNNGATWTGPNFISTPTYPSPNQMDNPETNMISIPAGSPGVTGSCASGCIFISERNEATSAALGNVFSYDDGLTWSDPVVVPQTWPYITEEHATIWLGGMQLMWLSRPQWDHGGLEGFWPAPIIVSYSSDLGTTWNSYSWNGSTAYGTASNLPISGCVIAPNSSWSDVFTRPSVAPVPGSPGLYTLLYGERYQCNSTSLFRWQFVTFNAASVFATGGINFPMPQITAIDQVLTTQPHTTYAYLTYVDSTHALMAFEQGNTTTTEDIYTTPISYLGQATASGINFLGGVTMQ